MGVGVGPRDYDVGVPYVGGGLYFDVGVHTPLQTMTFIKKIDR